MPNFSIKNVPDSVAEQLRARAMRNHRSIQGELMAILEQALESAQLRETPPLRSLAASYAVEPAAAPSEQPATDDLMARLQAILGGRGVSGPFLTRAQANDRTALRELEQAWLDANRETP